jgi:voltage-gated potassium channel Kch
MLGGLKMMRLVKLMRKFEGSIILVESIKESAAALFVPFFFLIVMVMLFASTIFFVEDFIKPQKAQFESIPHAIWFMVVTMTTVGYGDVSPPLS